MKTASVLTTVVDRRLEQAAPAAAPVPPRPVGAGEPALAAEPALALRDAVALYAREPSEANASRVEFAIAAVRRQRAPSRTRGKDPSRVRTGPGGPR